MASLNISALPADLFHLIAAELSERLDFNTLFNYICSSKQIASSGAINALYRISHESPVKAGGSEDLPLAEQDLIKRKWSLLWRSIVLSTFRETIHPYVKHLRVLDLRDLADLLDDDKFRQGSIEKQFFSGSLARFHLTIEPTVKVGTRSRLKRLDTQNIVSAIGDTITKQAPLLEGLTEPKLANNLSTVLTSWAPRMQCLRRLDLWDGQALADESTRNLLHVHCSNLDSLRMYQWLADDADQHLAAFISGMQPNKLVEFENISNCNVAMETCLALNNHGRSLTTLKLELSANGILAMRHLEGCTWVQTLAVESFEPTADMKATQNDAYLEITAWLETCIRLREITFANILSAPDLLLPVLLNDEIVLRKLHIKGREGSMYLAKDYRNFHESLAQKQSLEELLLSADAEGAITDDNMALVNALCSLKGLHTLRLFRVSDNFTDQNISTLAEQLPELEEFYTGGFLITDYVWANISGMTKMRSLTFEGFSAFTIEGILGYVASLGESNQGLVLAIDRAEGEMAIPLEGQEWIRKALADAVAGRFQYQLARDPYDFDSDESD